MSAMLQSLISKSNKPAAPKKKKEKEKEDLEEKKAQLERLAKERAQFDQEYTLRSSIHRSESENGGLSVKERKSQLSKRWSVTSTAASTASTEKKKKSSAIPKRASAPSVSGLKSLVAGNSQKSKSFDAGHKPVEATKKGAKSTASKLMDRMNLSARHKKTHTNLQELPPPDEAQELNQSKSSMDSEMSASASGRLQSHRRRSSSNNSNVTPPPSATVANSGRRRLSLAVQSRQKELTQKFQSQQEQDVSSSHSDEFLVQEDAKNPCKRRVSATVRSNKFMEEDSSHNQGEQDFYHSPNHPNKPLKVVKKRMSATVRSSAFVNGTSKEGESFQKRFSERRVKRQHSISRLNLNKVVSDRLSIQEKLQMERKKEEEKRKNSIARIQRPSSKKKPKIKNGVKIKNSQPPTPSPTQKKSVTPPPLEKEPPTLSVVKATPTNTSQDFASGRTQEAQFHDVYQMKHKLGEGAFGEVFQCIHKTTGVKRAVKVLHKDRMDEWEYDEVLAEFQMLTKMDNPNVIRVYEFYDNDNTFYMVQELAQGGELFDELEKHGKLKEQDVALLLKNILGCTHYLAQKRIVHRDINLENVLLEEPGNYTTVKLIDFGLAKECPEGDKLFELVGKARYLAPEVLGDNGYGLGYDVWSCGIIAAILLTGYFPFDSDNDMDVYNQIVEGAFINYNGSDWEGISDQAKDFVKSLLKVDESLRPTAEEALTHAWITGSTDQSVAPAGEVWVAPSNERKQEPPKPTKLAVPIVVDEPTASPQDFVSGRKDQFEDVYTVGKRLGEGAFGEVFVCTHKQLRVERAVKIIDKHAMNEWEYEDVIKEFQMLTEIDNPNVIRVYEFYDTEDTFYIVQELAQGGELFDELEKHGKLKEADVALLMKNILACTDYLAQNRIVHRDINLENILLEEPGNYKTVKLIDFGLASKCEEGQKLFELVGKARYLAPEVLGDDGYGLGYDVWSCGVIAAILLTGYFPFDSDNDMDVYNQIVEGAFINYRGPDWEGISDSAKAFVKHLLAFDEGDRPTAAKALTHAWITGHTDNTPATGEVWCAPTLEPEKPATKPKMPVETTKPIKPLKAASMVTIPTLVKKPTGSAQDFVAGREEKFEDVYELGKRLGEGAFGEVFVCTHKQLKVERAVKIIDKHAMDEWEYDDVINEFQMLTKIDNPNVIRVYEFYDAEDTFYIVQELAQGGELFDELDKHGKLKETDVALLMKHILGCTKYLADQCIVHRDINLENILLEESGNYNAVKLIDFGLAAKCEAGQKLFEMVGKARYLAPEVLGDDGYGLGYDVWSCGIIAAILLTGYFPFDSDNDMDVYNQIIEGAYINYDHADWKGISSEAKAFVKKLLTFKDDARPTSEEALNDPWITRKSGDVPAAGEVWLHTRPKQETESSATVRRPGGATQARPKEPEPNLGATQTTKKGPGPKLASKPKSTMKSNSSNTKVDEREAAKRLQRFFTWVKPLVAMDKKESSFWVEALEDVERRRQEDLIEIRRMVEFEKQQVRLEYELEYRGHTYDASVRQMAKSNLQMAAVRKGELRMVKQTYQNEKKNIHRLRWDNHRLASGQPLQSGSVHNVQTNVRNLQAVRQKWMAAVVCLRQAKSELRQCIAAEKRKGKLVKGISASERSDSSKSSSSSSSSDSSDSSSSSSSSSSSGTSFGTDVTDEYVDKKPRPKKRGGKKSTNMSKSNKSADMSDLSYSWPDHKSRMDASAPAQLSSNRKIPVDSNRRSNSAKASSGKSKRLSLAMDGSLRRTDSSGQKPKRRNSVGSTDMDKEMKGAPKRKGNRKKKDTGSVPPLVEIGKKEGPSFKWQAHSKKLPSNGRRASTTT